MKEQKIGNINFYAFIYFISIDLSALIMEDICLVKSDKFVNTIKFNPFHTQQNIVREKIREIYYFIPSGIKKNKGKYFTEFEAYKRIFDVYLYFTYISKNNLDNSLDMHNCIVWLIEKGHKFSKELSTNEASVNTGTYNSYIEGDKTTIEIILKNAEKYFP